MLDQVFLHLVQYADELKNKSRPSIECGVFKNLENMHVSHTNEPSMTLEYRTPCPIDFAAASTSAHILSSSSYFGFKGLNPLDCLKHSSEFHCDKFFSTSSLSPDSFTYAYPPRGLNEAEGGESAGDSSFHDSSEGTDPFCISSPDHSRISSDNCVVEKSLLDQRFSFDPFGDPIFRCSPPCKDAASAQAEAGEPIDSCASEITGRIGQKDAEIPESNRLAFPDAAANSQAPASVIPSMDPASKNDTTNLFVANFPSHWSKSDLWDFFEGLPVATVHVLPEKKNANEDATSGGTGFVNITREHDAKALLTMLDKKIWLIDGSALKFRKATSSAPSEPTNSFFPKRNRTVRRHQHKLIDRLRAELTVGNKQIGACDRHQIVVYKNSTSTGCEGATLSVVHGCRQRNSYFTCAASDSSILSSPQRPFLDFLKSQLSRWNNYNSPQAGTSAVKQGSMTVSPPRPSIPSRANVLARHHAGANHTGMNSALTTPTAPVLPVHLPLASVPHPCVRVVHMPNRLEGVTQQMVCVPRPTYVVWPQDVHSEAPFYHSENVPTLGFGILPAFDAGYAQTGWERLAIPGHGGAHIYRPSHG